MKVTAVFILSLGALVAAQDTTGTVTATDGPQTPTATVVPSDSSSLGGTATGVPPGAPQTTDTSTVTAISTGTPTDTTSPTSNSDTVTTTTTSSSTPQVVITNTDPPSTPTTLVTATTTTRPQTSAVQSRPSAGGAFVAMPTNALGPVMVMAGLFAAAMV